MSETFTSGVFGYSIRYPAGWTSTKARISTGWDGDFFEPSSKIGRFRVLSIAVPDVPSVDDWITQNVTPSDVPACAPPRNTLEQVTIDGTAGRFRGFCGTPPFTELEATVVVGDRVYVFTLFAGDEAIGAEAEARALFDAFTASVRLRPQEAQDPPGASPS